MKYYQLYAQDGKNKKNKNTPKSASSLPAPPIRGFSLWVDTIKSAKSLSLCLAEITNHFKMCKLELSVVRSMVLIRNL